MFKSPEGSFTVHTYMHLDCVKIEFLSCIKKIKFFFKKEEDKHDRC